MFRLCLSLVVGVGFLAAAFSAGSVALGDETLDRFVNEKLAQRVNIDGERDSLSGHLKRLSKAMGVPIEGDTFFRSVLLNAGGQSFQARFGDKPAGELLEWILNTHVHDENATFLIETHAGNPPSMKIVPVARRQTLEQEGYLVPPFDPSAAQQLLLERLARPVRLAKGDRISPTSDRIDLQKLLERISREIELPIDFHDDSMRLEGMTKNQAHSWEPDEAAAGEMLQLALRKISPDGKMKFFLADDVKKRTPQAVRIVLASRAVLEKNPARFTPPRRRPTTGADIDAALRKPVTLQKKSISLQEAAYLLAQQSRVRIHFTGLRDEWPNEYQKFDVDAVDQPLGTMLKKMLDDAGAAAKQEIVFLTFRFPAAGPELRICTRTFAASQNWVLPAAYVTPAEKK